MKRIKILAYHWYSVCVIAMLFPMFLLVLGLDIFFIYCHVIINRDITGIVPVLLLTAPCAFIYIEDRKKQILKRFFLTYHIDKEKIRCRGMGWKSWEILWNDVVSYAVLRNVNAPGLTTVEMSIDEKENFTLKPYEITPKRIIIQADKTKLSKIYCVIPDDMKITISRCIEQKKDGFFKRKTKDRGRFSVLSRKEERGQGDGSLVSLRKDTVVD